MRRSETTEERALLERWGETVRLGGASSIAEAVRDTLTEAILASELPSGWRLSEARLAVLFDVSRTPVREALLALAASNLARRDGRGGLRVGSITPDQMLDVYVVRQSIEGLAAALAAESASPRLVSRLRDLNRLCRLAFEARDFGELTRLNHAFHAAISSSTGNEVLIRFSEEISNWIKRLPSTTLSTTGAPVALDEHDQIIAAIESRDSGLAEQLVREHISRAERIRIEVLFDRQEKVSAGPRRARP